MGERGSDALRAVGPLAPWVPAGWYPDPIGVGAARFWDGKQWTERYRDAPGPQPLPAGPNSSGEATTEPETADTSSPATAPAAAFAAPPDPPNQKPSAWDRWKKLPKWAQITIGVVVLLFVIGIASGGSKKSTTTQSTTSTQVAVPVAGVELTLATGNYATTASRTTLHGTTSPGATVTVNEQPVAVHGNHWAKSVSLHEGDNTMRVSATKTGHTAAAQTIVITRHESQAEREAKQRAHEAAEQAQKQHYIESAQTVSYAQLNKNPEEYVGKVVSFRGQIFQIQEEAGEGNMLLSVTEVTEGFWDDHVWVNFSQHVKAAEKDIVTVYGEVTGQKSYKTQIGGETYVPEMTAKYVVE